MSNLNKFGEMRTQNQNQTTPSNSNNENGGGTAGDTSQSSVFPNTRGAAKVGGQERKNTSANRTNYKDMVNQKQKTTNFGLQLPQDTMQSSSSNSKTMNDVQYVQAARQEEEVGHTKQAADQPNSELEKDFRITYNDGFAATNSNFGPRKGNLPLTSATTTPQPQTGVATQKITASSTTRAQTTINGISNLHTVTSAVVNSGGGTDSKSGVVVTGKNASKVAEDTKSRTIGHYVVGKSLGSGTFGKVRIGTHTITGEKVAIKILEKDRIKDKGDVERVTREINILKKVRHPNVIQLYEIIETSRQLFLIMEYASGGELFDYIVKKKKLKEIEACKFFQQVISGVDYIHRCGITHRDLKPENLLLDEQNKLKIVDFGLSNTYTEGSQLKTACGSPCYAAPEMIAGKKYNGLGSDIWSCGIILYAMTCGYLPFEDANTNKLYKKILACDYAIPNTVSKDLKSLMQRILKVDPKVRITIAEIRLHPWFAKSVASQLQGIVVGKEKIPVIGEFLDELKEHFDESTLEQASVYVENNKHNQVTSTYYLLLKKKERKSNQNYVFDQVTKQKSQILASNQLNTKTTSPPYPNQQQATQSTTSTSVTSNVGHQNKVQQQSEGKSGFVGMRSQTSPRIVEMPTIGPQVLQQNGQNGPNDVQSINKRVADILNMPKQQITPHNTHKIPNVISNGTAAPAKINALQQEIPGALQTFNVNSIKPHFRGKPQNSNSVENSNQQHKGLKIARKVGPKAQLSSLNHTFHGGQNMVQIDENGLAPQGPQIKPIRYENASPAKPETSPRQNSNQLQLNSNAFQGATKNFENQRAFLEDGSGMQSYSKKLHQTVGGNNFAQTYGSGKMFHVKQSGANYGHNNTHLIGAGRIKAQQKASIIPASQKTSSSSTQKQMATTLSPGGMFIRSNLHEQQMQQVGGGLSELTSQTVSNLSKPHAATPNMSPPAPLRPVSLGKHLPTTAATEMGLVSAISAGGKNQQAQLQQAHMLKTQYFSNQQVAMQKQATIQSPSNPNHLTTSSNASKNQAQDGVILKQAAQSVGGSLTKRLKQKTRSHDLGSLGSPLRQTFGSRNYRGSQGGVMSTTDRDLLSQPTNLKMRFLAGFASNSTPATQAHFGVDSTRSSGSNLRGLAVGSTNTQQQSVSVGGVIQGQAIRHGQERRLMEPSNMFAIYRQSQNLNSVHQQHHQQQVPIGSSNNRVGASKQSNSVQPSSLNNILNSHQQIQLQKQNNQGKGDVSNNNQYANKLMFNKSAATTDRQSANTTSTTANANLTPQQIVDSQHLSLTLHQSARSGAVRRNHQNAAKTRHQITLQALNTTMNMPMTTMQQQQVTNQMHVTQNAFLKQTSSSSPFNQTHLVGGRFGGYNTQHSNQNQLSQSGNANANTNQTSYVGISTSYLQSAQQQNGQSQQQRQGVGLQQQLANKGRNIATGSVGGPPVMGQGQGQRRNNLINAMNPAAAAFTTFQNNFTSQNLTSTSGHQQAHPNSSLTKRSFN